MMFDGRRDVAVNDARMTVNWNDVLGADVQGPYMDRPTQCR